MTAQSRRCPTPTELERGFWSGDTDIRAHTERCVECSEELSQIEALVEAGRDILPSQSSPRRREDIRTTLLAKREPAARQHRPKRPWVFAAPFAAAAAAIAIAWWAWPSHSESTTAIAENRGAILEHAGASYQLSEAQPDEIVRLVHGTLTVSVDPLQPGERFRVITGDAELEVKGTAFDVTADGDHLVAVRVNHGVVEVRVAGAEPELLTAGQSWQPHVAVAPQPEPQPAIAIAPPDPVDAGVRMRVVRRTQPSPSPAATAVPQPTRVEARSPDAGPVFRPRSAAQVAFEEGWAAIRAHAFDAAAAAFGRAAGSGGGIAEDARYWKAVALSRAGHNARAAAALDDFLDAHPGAVRAGEVSAMLGWLLLERREYDRAERRFRAAIKDRSERVRNSAAEGLRAIRAARP